MKPNLKNLYLNMRLGYILILLVLLSCKKIYITNIVESGKKNSWSELTDPFLSYNNKDQRNSLNINDSQICFVSNFSINLYNAYSLTKVNGSFANAIYPYENFMLGKKPFISKKILITSDENICVFRRLTSPAYSQGHGYLNPAFNNTDTNFIALTAPFVDFCTPQVSVFEEYFLVPFSSKKDNSSINHLYLTKLKDTIKSGIPALEVEHFKTISFSATPGTSFFTFPRVYSIHSVYNKFFVSLDNNFYRVDTLGNIKSFGAPMYAISNIFVLNNLLFAINPVGRIYVSTDQGENFQLFNNSNNGQYGFLGFKAVKEKIIAFYLDQIWNVTFDNNELKFTELKNDGLQYHKITSIEQCGNKYFVTTKSGVFYRDSVNMFEPKN